MSVVQIKVKYYLYKIDSACVYHSKMQNKFASYFHIQLNFVPVNVHNFGPRFIW